MGCHNPLGLGLGEAQPLVLLPPLAAGPRGSSPLYIVPPVDQYKYPIFPQLSSTLTIICTSVLVQVYGLSLLCFKYFLHMQSLALSACTTLVSLEPRLPMETRNRVMKVCMPVLQHHKTVLIKLSIVVSTT
jgi:hypothetical protein